MSKLLKMKNETSPPESEQPKYTTPYKVSGNSPINFGKFKGKTHSEVFLDPNNYDYIKWLMMTPEDFAVSTKKWITQVGIPYLS